MLYIIGGKVITMEGDVWENGYLAIENGKIMELGTVYGNHGGKKGYGGG